MNRLCTMFGLMVLLLTGCNNDTLFSSFPDGAEPSVIGEKLVIRYYSSPFRNFDGINSPPGEVTYPEVCTWFGALKFVQNSNDKQLLKELENRFYPLLGQQKHLMQKPDHVDHTVFGTVPLMLYQLTGQESFFHLGIDFADRQWQMPKTSNEARITRYRDYLDDGLSWQTRFWIDDMYMISAIQTQAYISTGDETYVNRAAYQMSVYLDSIQQPNGLFYHAKSAPFFWCRGNGWMAAGMTELLTHLPKQNEHYDVILEGYLQMMEALRETRKEDGLWGQLVDDPNSWTETSGSAMFTYAIISGVKNGWLDRDIYEPIAEQAWIALVAYLNVDGDLAEVCMGTNVGSTREYYLDRKRIVGDLHGQAAMLWCASALL